MTDEASEEYATATARMLAYFNKKLFSLDQVAIELCMLDRTKESLTRRSAILESSRALLQIANVVVWAVRVVASAMKVKCGSIGCLIKFLSNCKSVSFLFQQE